MINYIMKGDKEKKRLNLGLGIYNNTLYYSNKQLC